MSTTLGGSQLDATSESHLTESGSILLRAYSTMVRIRCFEEKVEELFRGAELSGSVHLSIGQEASAVGECFALMPQDYLFGHHRSHGHCLARGSDPKLMMAELFGRANGYCKGKGGSLHLANASLNYFGSTGIVGAALPIAVGVGLSIKYRASDQVVMCVFGDGASNEGTFHESLNMASTWSLPAVFVCENNLYGFSTPFRMVSRLESVADRAQAYGIPGLAVDGNDFLAVYDVVARSVSAAREGKGPVLIETRTYRHRGHSKSDSVRVYRTREEEEGWKRRDPIAMLREHISAYSSIALDFDKIEQTAREEIEEAVRFAKSSPLPQPSEAFTDIFRDE
jgi:TPP-dependent pyruvate/acetoin dehydrogenase alpha subunit